jgi:peptide/nickel transport system permease protein
MSVAEKAVARAVRPTKRNGRFLRRYRRNRAATVAALVLLALVIVVIFAGELAPYSPLNTDLSAQLQAPSWHHLLGTDEFGRDQLSRVLYGGRASLAVGLGATILSVAVGLLVGLQAGFGGRFWDTLLMRVTDGIMAFPAFFLVVAVTAITGPSLVNVTLIIGITAWPVVARLVRAEVLTLKQRDFVTSARLSGVRSARIMRTHLIPNIMPSLIVAATLQIAFAILTEATLSFLGLGVNPPTPSWGNMLTDSENYLFTSPWVLVGPGAAIVITVLCLNFVGDGLRESLDPRLRTR